jgi:vacuolar protein sorting-associated protein 72
MSNNDDSDIPMTDTPIQDDHDSEGDEHLSSSDDEPSMVVTRERRQNAGNRMSRLLELAEAEGAEPEEDYGEIFQEAADDVEFEGDEGDEQDFNMDSSSEEEAEGDEDEDQGERELKKELRTQSKKRKRESLLQHAMKRAATRIAPVPLGASQPPPPPQDRPKKKSERVSWLPETESGPVRSSRRSLAVQNKQEIHDRLKEKERHRLKTVEVMKAAEARKEAAKPKILTQDERLKEAALIEKRNSKSLNRWETNEKRRAAEQAERLAALKNRKLEGPIITFWSGPSIWVDGKLKRVGKEQPFVQEVVKENSKIVVPDKKDDTQAMDIGTVNPLLRELSAEVPSIQPPSVQEPTIELPIIKPAEQPLSTETSQSTTIPSFPKTEAHTDSPLPAQGFGNFLDGIQMYANPTSEQQDPLPQSLQHPSTYLPTSQPLPRPPKPPPGPPTIATRNLIILSSFDQPTTTRQKDPDTLRLQLLGWAPGPTTTATSTTATKKLQPTKKSLCAITGQEARYRDPVTGVGYVNAYALKRVRRVVRGEMRWSGLLGAFVGEPMNQLGEGAGRPARGVPERFFGGAKKEETGAAALGVK